jgi:hypothetical protein
MRRSDWTTIRAHCEECCQHHKNRSSIKKSHDFQGHLDLYHTDQMLELKKSIIRHNMETQHKAFLLYEQTDNLRPFMIEENEYYKSIEITKREWDDLAYIIELEEQCRQRDYSKLEKLSKQK